MGVSAVVNAGDVSSIRGAFRRARDCGARVTCRRLGLSRIFRRAGIRERDRAEASVCSIRIPKWPPRGSVGRTGRPAASASFWGSVLSRASARGLFAEAITECRTVPYAPPVSLMDRSSQRNRSASPSRRPSLSWRCLNRRQCRVFDAVPLGGGGVPRRGIAIMSLPGLRCVVVIRSWS